MNLYKLSKNKLEPIKTHGFKLEKDIQKIIEENTEELFSLQFVKSELTIKNYRIDSLLFDPESKAFVIVEYKKERSHSVIDQGFNYLSVMLENKSDFVLEYNESTGANLKRNEIDWSQSRIIFVSPFFNSVQIGSVNFKDMPFELWEIKKFQNGIIGLNKISSISKESFKGLKSAQTKKSKVLDEIKTYDEYSIIGKSSEEIQEIYHELKEKISSWENIEYRVAKHYVTIRKGSKVKIYLAFQKKRIRIVFYRRVNFQGDIRNTPIKFDLNDPKKLFELYKDNRREEYRYFLENTKDFDYVISLLKQKYDS